MTRRLFVRLHRWAGLLMTGFLVVVGVTGSLLAFNRELERVFAPQLFAHTRDGLPRLTLGVLAEYAQAAAPKMRLISVTYTEPDQVKAYFAEGDDRSAEGTFDELFLDPWTGQELGRRKNGDLSQGLINLMPFVYDLHWRLASDAVGQLILGVIALVWSIDCFVAFYLTVPKTLVHFARRWRVAWRIKHGTAFYRFSFDLHRAGGLWPWAILFVFAWSSVMMNMRFIYEPVMQALFDYRAYVELPRRTVIQPRLDWRAAEHRAMQLIAEQAAIARFEIKEPLSLAYHFEGNAYMYEVRGSRDLFERSPQGGGTSITFDADTGMLIELFQPTGQHIGNTVESWLYALHMARVFGVPYRIFVCGLGFVIVIVSATGVYVWWKKSSARRFRQQRRSLLTRREDVLD
jgi:uncharacterized iron-regulated membrane protein